MFMNKEFNENYMSFSNTIMLELIKEHEKDNIFISPLSLFTALSMIYKGSQGKTKKQIQDCLQPIHKMSDEAFYSSLQQVLISMRQQGQSGFYDANLILADDENHPFFLPEYIKDLNELIDGKVFRSSQEANLWAEEKTKGLLRNVIKEEEFSQLCLMNVTSFINHWKEEYEFFDIIEEGCFINRDDQEEDVTQLMSFESHVVFDDHVFGFTKPYKKDLFDFMAIIPEKPDHKIADSIHKNLINRLQSIYLNRYEKKAHVILPEFKINKQYRLNETMKTLGLDEVFSLKANLESMTSYKGAYIDHMIHEASLSVNRDGTIAEAITKVYPTMGLPDGIDWTKPINIYLNHPFLFSIMHKESGLPLFIGVANTIGELTQEYDIEFDDSCGTVGSALTPFHEDQIVVIPVLDNYRDKIDQVFPEHKEVDYILCYVYEDKEGNTMLKVLCRADLVKLMRFKLYETSEHANLLLTLDEVSDGSCCFDFLDEPPFEVIPDIRKIIQSLRK